jgi:hypothetical protein
MVEVDGAMPLIGEHGTATLLDAFEGRSLLIAYYFMWYRGRPAPEQCEGCTFFTSQIRELTHLHSRDVTYATFCQGPYEESLRYRDFMGWQIPWYSALGSLDTLLVGRRVGMMHLVCYLRRGSQVFETYWTWMRGSRDGQQLPAARSDRVRTARGVGGLARRMAAAMGRGQGAYAYRRTSDRPMASPESRVFRQPAPGRHLTSSHRTARGIKHDRHSGAMDAAHALGGLQFFKETIGMCHVQFCGRR